MRKVIALTLVGGLVMAASPLAASAGSWGYVAVPGAVVLAPPAFVAVPPPIPVPRVEVVAPYPRVYGSVWVPGYWAWRGPHGYHWVRGGWVRPPHRGAHWVPPHWSRAHGGHRWVGGHWRHR